MNEIMDNNNFSMQDVVNLIGKQAINVNQILLVVGDVQREMATVKNDITHLKDQFNTIDVSNEQRNAIRRKASKRVYETLGVPSDTRLFTKKDHLMVSKYSKALHGRIYHDVRRLGHLVYPIGNTRKLNYQQVINELEAWELEEGLDNFTHNVDMRAEANRIAGKMGYR